jgi:hypothetical protein
MLPVLGLLLSNGPRTISAQGAKNAVAADGPETPERVQLNKAVIGFLSHTGFAHGGNGYEGIAFLVDPFRDSGLADPGDPEHGIDLRPWPPAMPPTMRITDRARGRSAVSTSK